MHSAGYIFDVEGTLVDCVPQTIFSLQMSLADLGLTVPYETYNSMLASMVIRRCNCLLRVSMIPRARRC
jgi:beta-phosphoglucomutase-like phosphatase (HAD superfamily)